jgi:alpha-L-fucosidase 2
MHSTNSPRLIQCVAGTAAASAATAATPLACGAPPPAPDLNLRLEAPVRTWDEGIPLGNGLLGGLLWGEADLLRLSLDRGDLWDERPAKGMDWQAFTYANLIRLVQEKQADEVNAIFDRNYGDTHPTKLPAGRLEITLPAGARLRAFELNLAGAAGYAWLEGETAPVTAFFSAAGPLALLHLPGPRPLALRLLAPEAVHTLGYPEAQQGAAGGLTWFVQEASAGLRYCVCVGQACVGAATVLALTVTSTLDDAEPLALAQDRVRAALAAGWDAACAPHVQWWERFWAQSSVSLPEAEIQRHYNLVRYFHGAASRRGTPPMPLQGVWTADSGGLPPWKGDYHNDLNTQMTYIAYPAAGHFEEGAAFLDLLWNLLPRFRQFAREFYGTAGAAVPGVMTLAGQPLGGWPHYSLSPTQGAWLGHLFYLHWRYTLDEPFRRDHAYPWCQEVGACLRELLTPDPDTGALVLPLSASPEIFGNSQRAWVRPNSNYDIMCLRTFFLALAEMAAAGDEADAADAWRDLAARLGPYHVAADGVLKINADESLAESHRHLSNLIGIHPFNLITRDGSDAERAIIRASTDQWDRLGSSAWCGYSFSWMACLRARVGDAEAALCHLDIFLKAFILRNGFHANGDQTGLGFSTFSYRPFTLEGNFLAMQAVHEMLLQSWSPTPGARDTEVLRLFPACPWRWHDASFTDLRAAGGWRVSARRENNATTWFRVTATRDGRLRLRDTFDGRTPAWSQPGVSRVGPNFEVALRAGQSLAATLPRPAAPPSAPADVAAPPAV